MIVDVNYINSIELKTTRYGSKMVVDAEVDNEELVFACLDQVGIPEMVKIILQENPVHFRTQFEDALKE